MSESIVMFNDDESAKYVNNIAGWVSRQGLYFGDGPDDERSARYAGCTHVECRDCGTPTKKECLICDNCQLKRSISRYEAMPKIEWDGNAMIYSEANDKYYSSPDEATNDLHENQSMGDLRLIICEPNYARQLDYDFFFDELPDDGYIPGDIEEAIDSFNKAIKGIILSWSPGKHSLRLSEE